MDQIYLDNNSTTRICQQAIRAMNDCFEQGFVNPSSQHRSGQLARRKLEETRESLSRLLGGKCSGMDADRLIFTSGGTESNNLALRGLAGNPPGRVLISAIEHPSVIQTAEYLASIGFDVERLPVDADGLVQMDNLKSALETPTRLVSLMVANNETGVIQPVQRATRLCHAAGALIHTDAVQAVGKIPVDFRELGVDAMSFSAHKFHGPRGVGGLIVRSGIEVRPILFGGFQQMATRPGTEDVALATGMLGALSWLHSDLDSNSATVSELRDQLQTVVTLGCGKVVCNGGGVPRVPHTLNLSFVGLNRQAFLIAADLAGLAVSTGSACASGSSDPSHVISAMTADKEVVEGSIRISLSVQTTRAEIEEAARCLIKIANDLRGQI